MWIRVWILVCFACAIVRLPKYCLWFVVATSICWHDSLVVAMQCMRCTGTSWTGMPRSKWCSSPSQAPTQYRYCNRLGIAIPVCTWWQNKKPMEAKIQRDKR